jgi:hypothetical protein
MQAHMHNTQRHTRLTHAHTETGMSTELHTQVHTCGHTHSLHTHVHTQSGDPCAGFEPSYPHSDKLQTRPLHHEPLISGTSSKIPPRLFVSPSRLCSHATGLSPSLSSTHGGMGGLLIQKPQSLKYLENWFPSCSGTQQGFQAALALPQPRVCLSFPSHGFP